MQDFQIKWRGIEIRIRWEENWLNLSSPKYDVAHLDIESILPCRARLPITYTGYKSHFTTPAEIKEYGGPVAFVTQWLNEAAKASNWKEEHANNQQLSLF